MFGQIARSSLLWFLLCPGCNSPQTKACHEKMAEAQSAVNTVESDSVDSLTRSIQLIELAESTCRTAGRDGETKQLTQARERLTGHRVLVEERDARRKERESLSPTVLEKLVREGDPNCPRGQAYQNKASGKEIRCTGLQPVEMGWEQARKYFASRNFRRVDTGDDRTLTLESGGEKFVFRYDQKDSTRAADCVIVYPRPGISWQEAVARSTGIPPERLKNGSAITVGQRRMPLTVDEQNQVARLGDCKD